jgi:hypothetical protein
MTDADGNDVASIRAPMVRAPLGTYCGWNLRARRLWPRRDARILRQLHPIFRDCGGAADTGDPRRSVIERYPNPEAYVAAIAAAARQLVEEGLMLDEDVERATKAAADWGRPRHDIKLK